MSAQSKEVVLGTIMQASGEGVLVWSVPDGTLSDCNEAAARVLGVTREGLAGRTIAYPWVLAREDGSPLPLDERGAVQALRTGQSQPSRVMRVGRPDGTWAWVRTSSVVLRDAAAPYAVITTFVDVTELRQTQEQMRVIASRLGDAMAGADVGIWELDLASLVAVRNARWAEILGYTPDEIEPTLDAFSKRIHPEERENCEAIMAGGFRSGEPFVIECRAMHKDGDWRWVQARGRVVERSAEGLPQRAAGRHRRAQASRRGFA